MKTTKRFKINVGLIIDSKDGTPNAEIFRAITTAASIPVSSEINSIEVAGMVIEQIEIVEMKENDTTSH